MTKKYDEIRDLLDSNKLDGLFGKGASEELIEACEKALKLRFSPSYRLFLNEFGWGYFGSLDGIVGLGRDIPKEWERSTSLLYVVNDERDGPLSIPDNVVPIYGNGAGDWYAIDCCQNDCEESPVVFISHEQAATEGYSSEKCADSFADWVFDKLSKR